MDTYDMIVIGSGPAGQKAAIAAAKLGHRAAIVERWDMVGGVCINTGTIPSKTLREAVLYLTGMDMRELYGASYRVKEEITISDLLARLQHVIGRETEVIRAQLQRNHIELVPGTGETDDEIIDALSYHFSERGVRIMHSEEYERVEARADAVVLYLKSGKKVKSDVLL